MTPGSAFNLLKYLFLAGLKAKIAREHLLRRIKKTTLWVWGKPCVVAFIIAICLSLFAFILRFEIERLSIGTYDILGSSNITGHGLWFVHGILIFGSLLSGFIGVSLYFSSNRVTSKIIRALSLKLSSYSDKQLIFFSLFIVVLSTTTFGLWFKIKQLTIASPEILKFYPVIGYVLSVLQTWVLMGALWGMIAWVIRFLARDGTDTGKVLLFSSLPFLVFSLAPFGVELKYQATCFLIVTGVLVVTFGLNNKSALNSLKEPVLTCLVFLLIFVVMFKSYSPLYHTSFFDTWGRNDFFVNLEHIWESAKAYDFSQNFSQQAMLGGFSTGTYMLSELSALIVLLFDIPIVDDMSKLDSIKFMYFFLYVFASFGGYLFFRYGLRLSYLASFIGGLAGIFGNVVILSFLGNEYNLHHSQILFFPWVLLFIKLAHSSNRLVLACAAGMVASLCEYAMSAHPEVDMVYFAFCNLYNFYLTIVGCLKTPFAKKTIGHFLVWASAYPVFHGVGLAYRLIPDVDAVLSVELALVDNFSDGIDALGLWWLGELKNFSYLFFRYWDTDKLAAHIVNPANGTATPVFYTGQFSLVMVFALIAFVLLAAYQRVSGKSISCIQNIKLPDLWFFFPMLLFLGWNMPMGHISFLDTLMAMTGFLRIHSIDRMNMFFYFIILVNALLGLTWVLRLRSYLIFNLISLFYFFCLFVIYSIPAITTDIPDKIGLDLKVFAAVYIVVSFKIFQNNFPLGLGRITQYKLKWVALACQLIFGLVLITTAVTSYFTICGKCKEYVKEFNNEAIRKNRDNVYLSFRAALVQFRNNQHDQASVDFLDQWAQRFLNHLGSIKETLIQEKYSRLQRNMEKLSSKQELFEFIAPTLDNYYLDYGPSVNMLGANTAYFTTLSFGMWNALQYHLPDSYQLLAMYGGGSQTSLLPLGKNSELSGGLFYSAGSLYPGVSTNFHLRALRPDSLKVLKGSGGYDYMAQPLGPDMVLKTKNFKKLFNIYGINYLIFHNYVIDASPDKSKIQDGLIEMGFEPWKTPKAYHFEPRYPNVYSLNVFRNPQSYGKAYIANWIRTIKPSENLARRSVWELPKAWPQSQELVDNFDHWIAKIPDNIQGAAIIEVADPKWFTKEPMQTGPQKSSVDIIKIIGSMAVFDVDCLDETCWFVYNTTALKDWKAYSGSEKLPIHEANLGFLSVPLEKGMQLLWFEYRADSGIIGIIITCGGWILVFFIGVLRPHVPQTPLPARSEVLGNAWKNSTR
jgi:hypothetical protein